MRGVLLLAHGTPESIDDMPEYLRLVRGGRSPSAELVEEMRENYRAIGGRSPLTEITRLQAEALRRELGDGTPVYFAMRNWKPFIADVLSEIARDGVTDLVALPLAPQYSALSVGRYREAVEKATPQGIDVRFISAWHEHPGLLDAFAEKLAAALAGRAPFVVVFTAHSLPLRAIREGDPYADHVKATARGVAARAGIDGFQQAYQSAGRTPEPWLGPSLEEWLEEASMEGEHRVLVVPVSFVSDHTEILFDIDQKARSFARSKGIELERTDSLNASPTFVRALADLVRSNRG